MRSLVYSDLLEATINGLGNAALYRVETRYFCSWGKNILRRNILDAWYRFKHLFAGHVTTSEIMLSITYLSN